MKRAAVYTLALFALFAPHGAAGAQAPKKWPDTALLSGSVPYYAVLASSPWTNQPAYVLFDGNVAGGYRRAFVWVPGHPQYNTPQALAPLDDTHFSPFTVSSAHANGQDAASVSWALGWTRISRGGRAAGPQESYDYVSGKKTMVTVTAIPAVTYAQFNFTLNYRYGSKSAVMGNAQAPLDVTIPGILSVMNVWSNVPAAGLAPWGSLTFSMPFKAFHEKDKAKIVFNSQLSYGNVACQVQSVPKEGAVTLLISPYMEPPAYSNTVAATEAFSKGVTMDLPYGWYDFTYAMRCRGLGISGSGTYLYPFSKPNSQAGSAGR